MTRFSLVSSVCGLCVWFLISSCVLLSTAALDISPESDKYFYIYNWSKQFGDVYPPPGAELHPESHYDHSFHENNGFGTLLDSDIGLFQTWQFALYKNIMSRLRVSKYRTFDPSKASAFVIPFDAGVHSYLDHRNGKQRLGSPFAWSVINLLQEAQKDPVLWKNQGHDHFAVFGLTEFVMTGIAVKEFWMGVCQNCSALTIEASPIRVSTPYHRSRKYWYAVPYPSSFHWWEGSRILPWSLEQTYTPSYRDKHRGSETGTLQTVVDSTSSLSKMGLQRGRDILVLFIGSLKTKNTNSNLLRRRLYAQCQQAPEQCQWHTTAHACNGVITSNVTQQMLLFRHAQFCLAPPGDSVTRKSIFDSLIAGCIPVIFARASLSQYGWFLSEEEVSLVSVYIPKDLIMEETGNFMDALRAISAADLLKKQQAIARVASRLQYTLVPAHATEAYYKWEMNLHSHATPQELQSSFHWWEPPFEDAAGVITSNILNPASVAPIGGFSDEQIGKLNCLQNEIMAYHPDYIGIFHGTQHLNRGRSTQRAWSTDHCIGLNVSALAASMEVYRMDYAALLARMKKT